MMLPVVMLLLTGCISTTTTAKPTYEKITERDVVVGVGDRGDRQREVLRERVVTETETRCCGPRFSILDIWNKKERVIREKDTDYEQIIEPINKGGSDDET